jgi:DNA-binding XRE family transcriptional regulator
VNEEREHGTQPLDGLMTAWGLGNHDLVDASTEQLTHKQVQRARSGRTLTLKMMQKLTRSLNVAVWYRLKNTERETYFEYFHKQLHDYILQVSLRAGRKDRDAWFTSSGEIGDLIRAARNRLGLTQAQLAKLVRVTKGTLLTWEGKSHQPGQKAMGRLADLFGAAWLSQPDAGNA